MLFLFATCPFIFLIFETLFMIKVSTELDTMRDIPPSAHSPIQKFYKKGVRSL